MPCNSDYLNPTQKELDSRKFCQHIYYLFTALGKKIPDWVITGKDEYYGAADHVNEATVLLCGTIRKLTEEQLNAIVYNGKSRQARELANFWDDHEEADKQRKQEEQKQIEKQEEKELAEYRRLKKKFERK